MLEHTMSLGQRGELWTQQIRDHWTELSSYLTARGAMALDTASHCIGQPGTMSHRTEPTPTLRRRLDNE